MKITIEILETIKTQIGRRISNYLVKANKKKVKQMAKIKHQAKADALRVEVERLDKIIKKIEEKMDTEENTKTEDKVEPSAEDQVMEETKELETTGDASEASACDATKNNGGDVKEEKPATDDSVVEMSFDIGLRKLLCGEKVARKLWDGKYHLESYSPNHNSTLKAQFIIAADVDGKLDFWTPNMTDLTAGDWYIVD